MCFLTLKEMQQDDEHARSKPSGSSAAAVAAAAASRAGGTRECRETLEAGAAGMARAHLAVMLARPLLEGAALYPAAMARLRVAREQAAQARPARAASAIARGWPWGPWLEAGRGSRQPLLGRNWLKPGLWRGYWLLGTAQRRPN